jgi:hypothetical protein
MSGYDKFLRESSGMGPVPGAATSVRGRRTRGRTGFGVDGPRGKGKDHYPQHKEAAGHGRFNITRSPRMNKRTSP